MATVSSTTASAGAASTAATPKKPRASKKAQGAGASANATASAPPPILTFPALTDEELAEVAKRVLRARIRLALAQPFLASSLMRLPVREVAQSGWCPTAATDGYHLFYNPAWVACLADAELRGVLAHEVLHVLFAHAERRAARDAARWNIACDHAINLLLIEQGFRLPAGGMLDQRWKGMPAEEIYAGLPDGAMLASPAAGRGAQDPDRQDENTSGALPGIGVDLLEPDDPRIRPLRSDNAPDGEQLDELRRELRDDAMARLKDAGARAFQAELEAVGANRIDWRSLLRAWLHERIKGDWQSYPFSKRHVHRGLFMPSPGLAVPGHIVFAVDTSGSMHREALSKIVGELRAFRETFPCRLTIIQSDARMQSVQTFEAMDGTEIPQRFELKGGGATDFRPVFDWVSKESDSAIVIYATDGYGVFPDAAPPCPVIWLLTPPHKSADSIPFGAAVPVRW